MVLSLLPVTEFIPTANAATTKTLDQAMAWLESVNGKTLYNGQCVGLIKEYYIFLGAPTPWGNACDYATNTPPEGWKKIPGATPQKGDILVWIKGSNNYGHVAICAGSNKFFHQNWHGKYVEILDKSYTGGFTIKSTSEFAEYWGVIRPDFCSHSSYDSNYLCKSCGAVKPSKVTSMSETTYIITTTNAKTRKGPYETCDKVNDIAKDTIITVNGKMTNTKDNLWYRLTDGSWIYSEHIKKYSITYADIADGTYRLKNVATGKYLIVDAGNGANKQNVSVWPLVESCTEQKWNLIEDSLGFKIHTCLSSGRVLNSYGDAVKPGNNVNIWNFIGGDATQRWKFQKVSGGYVIRNVSVPACVVSVGNGDDNVSVQTFSSGDKKQIWILEPVNGCSHSYDSGVITTLPSCTSSGVKTYSCTKCGSSYTSSVSAKGHSYVSETIKSATCTETGTKKYTCTACDSTKTETIATKGHSEVYFAETQATCTENGCTAGTKCSTCDTILSGGEVIYATGHSYDDGNIKVEPGCTSVGFKIYTCSKCNGTKVEKLAAKGHKEVYFAGTPATCTENGRTAVTKCSVCDIILSGDEVIYAAGHNSVAITEKAATCTENGNTSGTKCSVCNKVLSGNEVIKAKGHSYVTEITKTATCTEAGTKKVTCKNCGVANIETIAATGHKAVTVNEKAATCTENGYTSGTKCSVCNETLSGMTNIPALGHRMVLDTTTNELNCEVCGASGGAIGLPEIDVGVQLGDVDEDGKITAADARLALRASVGLENLNEPKTYAADVDKNGNVTAADARLILRYSVGLEKW